MYGSTSDCLDSGYGPRCGVICEPGLTWPLGDVLCLGSSWLVAAQCTEEGAPTTTERIAEMVVRITPSFVEMLDFEMEEVFDAAWAALNVDLFVKACAELLDVYADQVQVEVKTWTQDRARCLEAPNIGDFGLRILVLDDTGVSAADLAQHMLCSFSYCNETNTTVSNSTFLTTNITLISIDDFRDGGIVRVFDRIASLTQEEGGTIPAGLDGATVCLVESQVRVVDNFIVALPLWLSGEWTSCSAMCGDGLRIRNVTCSGIVCRDASKPAQEETCEDHTACSLFPCEEFNLSEDPLCGSVVLGSAVALCLCCFSGFACWCKWRTRYASTSRRMRVLDPWSGKFVTKEVTTYDLNHEQLASFGSQRDLDVLSDSSSGGETEGSSSGEDECGLRFCWISVSSDNDGLHPAYPEGAEVEYFSSSLGCWLTAFVFLTALGEGRSGSERLVSVVYNVSIGFTHQRRENVVLHLLRSPMRLNETVEVETSSGWELGRITKVLRTHSEKHYGVHVDETGAQIQVKSSHVRRYFPVDATLLVYLGLSSGWVQGVRLDDDCGESSTEQLPESNDRSGGLMDQRPSISILQVSKSCQWWDGEEKEASDRLVEAARSPSDTACVMVRLLEDPLRILRVPAHLLCRVDDPGNGRTGAQVAEDDSEPFTL